MYKESIKSIKEHIEFNKKNIALKCSDWFIFSEENKELYKKLKKLEKQRKKEIFTKVYNEKRKVKTEKVIALNSKKTKNFYALPYFLASEVTEADIEREEEKANEYYKFYKERF